MSKFKFLKIYRSKKIRYLSLNTHSDLFVVFLHGFMSDLEGKKPKAFQRTNAAEKAADDALKANIAAAATSGKPIVIDMMNISASGRKRQIDKLNLPPDYTKVGVVFQSEGSEDAIHSLSQSRNLLGQITTGERKTIPGFLFHLDVEMPLPGEFDKVIYVDNRGKVKDFDMRNRQQVNLYGTQTSEYDFDDEF